MPMIPDLLVAPLIDVSFLLLIFFLVTSTILKSERDLTMGVPVDGPSAEAVMPIVVGVEADGSVVLHPGGGQMLISSDVNDHELSALLEHFAMVRAVAAEREPVVQLQVAEEATQQRVVDVLNCFAKIGVTTVGLVDGGE